MIKMAPSMLAADFSCMGSEARRMEAAGADWLHCDIMDGNFVPNLSFGPAMVEAVRRHSSLPVDVHIMARDPQWMFEALKAAGATSLTLQVEAVVHLQRALAQVRQLGMSPAVALNPATPIEAVSWVLDDVDMVLIMSVNPGFGGQSLIPNTYEKVRAVRALLDGQPRPIRLQVDGGVTAQTIGALCAAGADTFVAGTALFKAQDAAQEMRAMRNACALGGYNPTNN